MISAERKTSIHKDMVKKAQSFPDFYSKYYDGIYGDKELKEMTTQPFWQSMRLTKRRLENKGLHMNLTLQDHKDKKQRVKTSFEMMEDGSNFLGEKQRNVVTQRNYQLNGKKLRYPNEYEHLNIRLLHGIVEGENAVCPNCGHEGKLSEYIDGCDYCGSLFEVKDFETKVSGFSLEENTREKLKKTIKRTAGILGFATAMMIIIGLICLIALFALVVQDNLGVEAVGTLGGVMLTIDLVPMGFRCIIILAVLYFILRIILLWIYRSRMVGEGIVKNVIANFSGEDFLQNLEYKLRNIHMANNASEVAAFASVSLENIVEMYHDVVDACIIRCRFKDVVDEGDTYKVNIQVTMRLTLLKGTKIRTRYVKLKLVLSGRKEVVHRKETFLREYRCEGCHAGINILEGRNCQYCGSPVDYARYGWVINEYGIEKKPANIHAIAKVTLISIYTLIFVSYFIYLQLEPEKEGWDWSHPYRSFINGYTELKETYHTVPAPDVLDKEAVLEDSLYNMESLIRTYQVKDAEMLMEHYLIYLQEEGFVYHKEVSGSNQHIFYKNAIMEGEEGYMIVAVSGTINSITVEVYGDEEVAQNRIGIEEKLAP